MLAISSGGKVVADLAGTSEQKLTEIAYHRKLTASIDKIVVPGSRADGAKACFKHKRFNNARQASTNNLGVDFATVGRTNRLAQNKRLKEMTDRKRRFQKVIPCGNGDQVSFTH